MIKTINFINGRIFDGRNIVDDCCAVFKDGYCESVVAKKYCDTAGHHTVDLQGDILSLGFCDLQVNGGGGVLFNADPSIGSLKTIAAAHRSLGTTLLLPTLITDSTEITAAAIDAAINATKQSMPGIAGLHLEGPHLSIEKKGAHDSRLIRPMQEQDLARLIEAAAALPVLKVTIAPESVSLKQVETLKEAGVLLSIGHSNVGFKTCMEYVNAGVSCVTHLFNAMSQLDSREPGIVGAALTAKNIHAGLIADGVHVDATSIQAAVNCMNGLQRLYLVSDAMAVAGTTLDRFELNGRSIHRCAGKLTLEDGTLAGADVDILSAIRFMVEEVGVELADALASAVLVPRKVVYGGQTVSLAGHSLNETIRIKADLSAIKPVMTH